MLFLRNLIFNAHKIHLLLNELSNFRFNLLNFGVVAILMRCECREVLLSGLNIIKDVIILFVFGIDGGLLSCDFLGDFLV